MQQRDNTEVQGPLTSGVSSELYIAACELVRRARAAQGLPDKITDPATIARVAALLEPVIED